MLTEKDKAYIQERVAYALAAIEEAGTTPGNLAAIIGQEIGLALQNKREACALMSDEWGQGDCDAAISALDFERKYGDQIDLSAYIRSC